MSVNNNFLILVKLLWTISILLLGDKTWISLLRPVASCNRQSVDLQCYGTGCKTPKVTVSGSLCWNYFQFKVLPCDLDSYNEYIRVYINGVHKYSCNPTGYRSDETWYNCGNYYHYSYTSFTVHLEATPYVWNACYNSAEGFGHFTVYGRMYFNARYYNVNAPTKGPTRSPSVLPTLNPTLLPTRDPTNLPTSLSPTIAPTGSPCVNKLAWCDHAEENGMCYAEDHETRIFISNECPVSCGTCFNSTLMPTSLPTYLPTLSPTRPTMSPSRKPSREPTHHPTVMPTASPTCIDAIHFCVVIQSFCNSSNTETKHQMATACAATCGFCTLEPTEIPTAAPSLPCKDSYAYCLALAQRGACYDEDRSARLHFQSECPVSCGTCNNRTVSPTSLPSPIPTIEPTTPTSAPSLSPSGQPIPYPTVVPTGSPTCVDTIAYCNIIESYCKNTDSHTLAKMLRDCTATCGYCTLQPSYQPIPYPTTIPTGSPSTTPELSPSTLPTVHPTTVTPSYSPTSLPSFSPTEIPSSSPTWYPSSSPTTTPLPPTSSPSQLPSIRPSAFPTGDPTTKWPSRSPSNRPSVSPSSKPSAHPSLHPTVPPTNMPSTVSPTKMPSNSPTECDDLFLFCSELALTGACYDDDHNSRNEIHRDCPVSCGTCNNNTISPTAFPTITPSARPSKQPSQYPTLVPTSQPTCSDLKVYCRKIKKYCSASDRMKTNCAATCGYCSPRPSLNLKASSFGATSLPSNDPRQSQQGGERGDRRRTSGELLL